jgi:hypothetical protein
MHQDKKGKVEAESPPYFPSLTLQHPSEVCFIFGGFANNQLEFFLLRLSPEMTLYAYLAFLNFPNLRASTGLEDD